MMIYDVGRRRFVRHQRVEGARISRDGEYETSAVFAERWRLDNERLFGQRMRVVVLGNFSRPAAAAGHDRQHQNDRSEEHTSELQSQSNLVCRLLLEKKKKKHQLTVTRYPASTSTQRT